MKFYKLDYYIDKLTKGEKFSFARYGDGELYCMWGKKGGNSNGCRYSDELRLALLNSMNHKDNFIYGLQRVLPQDEKKIITQYPEIDWHDSEFLGEAVASGELYPFIKQLNKMNVVIIGNESLKPIKSFLHYKEFIEVPKSNAFDFKPKIDFKKDYVYLFSCGMASNAFISEAHGADCWLIDVGHIWDAFVGNMSRCDLIGKTEEDINKNLCE